MDSAAILHIANLPTGANEEFLESTFSEYGTINKIILKERDNGKFAMIQYEKPESVNAAIQNLNYSNIDGKQIVLTSCAKKVITSIMQGNNCLFVSGLPENITAAQLAEIFSNFGDIITVKIAQSELKKGCAYVQFMKAENAKRARAELFGAHIGENELEIEEYFPKLRVKSPDAEADIDTTYTDIFIRGLPPYIKTVADLGALLLEFGNLEAARIIEGEDCAIARMETHEVAENVVKNLTGRVMGGRTLVAFRALSKAERIAYSLRESH